MKEQRDERVRRLLHDTYDVERAGPEAVTRFQEALANASRPVGRRVPWRRSTSRHRGWRPGATALVVAVVVGALGFLIGQHTNLGGENSNPGGPARGSPAASPRAVDPCASAAHCIVIQVSIAGDATVSGVERQPLTAPCASLAAIFLPNRGNPPAGAIGLPIVHSAGGHRLFIGASIEPYTGPGDYTSGIGLGAAPTTSTFATLSIDGRDYASGLLGPPPRYGTLRATVRGDGSGFLSFSGMINTTDPSRTVSGLVTWECT